MFRHSTRVAVVAAALAISSMGVVGLSTTVASASSPTVTCTGFTSNVKGVGSLTKCTDTKNTGGSGKAVANISKSTAVITWKGTGTTTESYKETGVTPNKCASGSTEIKEVSTTTGGTGAALKSIPKGQVATAYLCLNLSKGTVSLLPGTKYQV